MKDSKGVKNGEDFLKIVSAYIAKDSKGVKIRKREIRILVIDPELIYASQLSAPHTKTTFGKRKGVERRRN